MNFTATVHHDTYPAIESAKADLSGKVVYITGASKGLGRAAAISFAKAGAEGIAIGARSDLTSLEAEITSAAVANGKKAPKVLRLNIDVTEQASVENAAKEIEQTFGRLDILINNAGYLSPFTPMAETDPVTWWMNWEINIKGVYLVTRSLLPLMVKGGEKTIVNLTSIGGLNLTPGASGYQPSKNALLRFTEFICVDYAKDGILAYCLHPGGVKSDMGLKMPDALHASEYSLP
jgi:NAD(P)-dependent dehydrogenase (short-subunit alcohol dehydrogenase family)